MLRISHSLGRWLKLLVDEKKRKKKKERKAKNEVECAYTVNRMSMSSLFQTSN